MKKTLLSLLLSLAIVLVACETSDEISHCSDADFSDVSDTEQSKDQQVSEESESEVIENISLPPEVSESDYLMHMDGVYASFEDIVLLCEEVAVGKLLYAHPAYKEVIFAFSVSRWAYGERTDKIIYLHESRAYMAFGGYAFRGGEISFEQEKEYLLVLCSEERDGADHTYYSSFGNMYIPTEDLSQAKMYDDDIKNHTEKPELFSADAGEDGLNALIQYIVSLKQ
jgi:hypothetical protein